MKPSRSPARVLAAVSWLLILASCSPDSENGREAANGAAPAGTSRTAAEAPHAQRPGAVDIPLPHPDSMQADVAELVEQSWRELRAVLDDADTPATGMAEAYARFGLVCFGNGLLTTAEAAFENAHRLAPDDARWVYFLALLEESLGALDDAARHFDQVLLLRPNDPAALIRLGNVRFEQDRLDDARASFRLVLDADPTNAAALYGLGRIAQAEGNDGQAVEFLEAALAEQPDATRLNYLLGLAWRNLGDPDKAERYLARRGPAEPAFTDPLFDQISGGQAHIGGLWANLNLGSQAYVDGDYQGAVEKFQLATRDHPDDPRSWQSLGMALNRLGRREEAMSAYEKALALKENNAAAHQSLARLLAQDGRTAEAEQHLLHAIDIDPQRIAAHTNLAQLLFDSGRLEEALHRYEVIRKLDPFDAEADLGYALTLSRLKRTEEALRVIGQVLSSAGEDSPRAEAFNTQAHIYLQDGDRERAITSFESALEMNPDHRSARLNLARTLVRSRQFERALETYQAVIERWPDDEATRLEAAGGAILLNRATLARDLMEPAAVRESASPRLLSSFARLLALAPDPSVRDPARALDFAYQSYRKKPTRRYAETIALCLAATGSFEEAIDLQEQIYADAKQRGDAAAEKRLARNLQRYRARSLGSLPLDAG